MVDAAKRPRDGSDGDAAQKKQKGADAIDLTEVASPREKKCVEAMNSIAREFICPITHELPIAPVMAKDGVVYERAAIERWFKTKEGNPTSPSTGAVIGTELIPAPQIRNTIEALVKSGAIDGLEVATAWKQKLADETKVKELLAKTEGGDGDAMYVLGVWYEYGKNGLAIDKAQARAWYERSAAAGDIRGIAAIGECVLHGIGGSTDTSLGLVLVTEAAATNGSDFAAYTLGKAFFYGNFGLTKDPVRARFWLKKVVDEEYAHKHLLPHGRTNAAEWLRELDGAGD